MLLNCDEAFRILKETTTTADEKKTVKLLRKIRAEIESLSNSNPSYWHSGDMVNREDVFDIIDKYI